MFRSDGSTVIGLQFARMVRSLYEQTTDEPAKPDVEEKKPAPASPKG